MIGKDTDTVSRKETGKIRILYPEKKRERYGYCIPKPGKVLPRKETGKERYGYCKKDFGKGTEAVKDYGKDFFTVFYRRLFTVFYRILRIFSGYCIP